ncbi:MAG: zf-TFIIB domain-containing protein [Deltaproteobacteria bacterium]|nr:zf-TFIIB domain-containing protein [Deltaproteobacteria bacterium]
MSEPSCPNCDVTLQPVAARARSGYLLALDQCPRCGGLWCDRWELFPVDGAEVARLDPVDQPTLWAPVAAVKREPKCPRCRIAMARFRDPLLPEDVRIERCRACEGMWLNRGELRRFKAARARPAPPLALPDGPIEQLAQHYGAGTAWPTIANLAQATNPPPPPDEPPDLTPQLMQSAAWLALRALLRLLLHI